MKTKSIVLFAVMGMMLLYGVAGVYAITVTSVWCRDTSYPLMSERFCCGNSYGSNSASCYVDSGGCYVYADDEYDNGGGNLQCWNNFCGSSGTYRSDAMISGHGEDCPAGGNSWAYTYCEYDGSCYCSAAG